MSHDLISLLLFLLVFTGVIYVLVIYNKKLRAKINDNLRDSTRGKGKTLLSQNKLNEQEYLYVVKERLKQQQYAVTENITYKNQIFKHVAKRTKFETERFGFCTTFFVFSKLGIVDIPTLKDFSNKAFRYSRKTRGIYPPPGLLYGYLCFPVAVVDSINDKTIDFVRRTEPPRHWGAVEKLVIFCLETNMLHYCEATFKLGSWYYDWDRLIIQEMLTP